MKQSFVPKLIGEVREIYDSLLDVYKRQVSYLLYLGGRFLYGFLVRHSYRFAVPLYLFGYFSSLISRFNSPTE